MRAALATLVLLCLGGSALAGPGKLSPLQMPKGESVEATTLADVNGDGDLDLIVAAGRRKDDFRRTLRVYRRRAGVLSFAAEPDLVFELDPSVIALGVGDMDPAPGDEILFFTVTGVFLWRTGDGVEVNLKKLLTGEFLWQLPHPEAVFFYEDGVVDLDGDGLADLVFPQPDGFRIARQTRSAEGASFEAVFTAHLPTDFSEFMPTTRGGRRIKAQRRARELRLSMTLGGSKVSIDEGELDVVEAVPVPIFADWDGDRRPDLMLLSGETLHIWRQRTEGGFGKDPDHSHEFPIEMDVGRRLDLSFGAHSADLNGDRKTDCIILAGDRRSDDIRTQILVYLQGVGKAKTKAAPLFGEKGMPQQVLIVGGIVGAVDLTDVDGNGLPDLVLGTVKIDALDAIRAASSGRVEAVLRVYLNQRGRLSRQPDLTFEVSIAAADIKDVGKGLSARFLPDLSGDRIRELLVRDQATRFRIYLVRRGRSGLTVLEKPLVEQSVSKGSKISVFESAGRPPELVIAERRRVHHLRFGR